jgi:hypothetical protein
LTALSRSPGGDGNEDVFHGQCHPPQVQVCAVTRFQHAPDLSGNVDLRGSQDMEAVANAMRLEGEGGSLEQVLDMR